MADFSLAINEDQQQLKDWIHTFAVDVMRPAAEEWDEREEFPWPVVQEAAKIGLYGFDFIANAMLGDPTGLTLPIAVEEMFWGDAGMACRSGLRPRRRRHLATDAEQTIGWGLHALRHRRRREAPAPSAFRARRRLRRRSLRRRPSTTPATSRC